MSMFRVVGLRPSFGIEVSGVRMPLGDGDGGFQGMRHIRNRKGEKLKAEAACHSETSVCAYETTRVKHT